MDKDLSAVKRIESFQRFGSKLGLDRMSELVKRLGHPEKAFKVIHIAGTNGKGSVSRFIYETLLKAGYKAGLYTSPYLEVFNERIEFMGEYISDSDLELVTDKVLNEVDAMVSEGYESPTEFEVVTAICFQYFKEKGCGIAILEVGLGGRGDSTNVISSPMASVITSISYDHMDRLGSTISEIAGEKAGIIKEGSPVIVSTERSDALRVFRKEAERMGAPLFDAREACRVENVSSSLMGQEFDIRLSMPDGDEVMKGLKISMSGIYQLDNAAEAIYALELLRSMGKIEYTPEDLKEGMKSARVPGRFEIFSVEEKRKTRYVILDGCHNEDGAKRLSETMKEYFPSGSVLTVTGVLKDKDIDGILKHLTFFTETFIATEPDSERKEKAYDLAKKIHDMDKEVYEIPGMKDAVALAMSIGKGYDAILFAGSLYLIGKVRKLIREHYIK